MKFLFFYLLTSLSFLHSFSQNKNPDEFNLSKYYEKKLSFTPGRSDVKRMKPFNIQLLDWRADTSSVGFQRREYFTTPDIKAEFINFLAPLIDLKDDSNLSHCKVLVCLKKLYFSENGLQINNSLEGGIVWKADFFEYVNNKFTYLGHLDTIITDKNMRVSVDATNLISLCLELSAKKINSALHSPNQPDKFVDINQFKNKFSDIPILLDHKKKKGLYMNYEDFLNNTPAAVKFEVDKDKYTDALFVFNSRGESQLTRDLWGYCDGENMYIKSGEKYFQLCRVNNTFYFYGAKDLKKYVYSDPGTASLLNVATNTNRKITKYYLSYHPYQLDISTGNIY